MILGLGTDLCEVSRMREETAASAPGFAEAVFTPGEIAYCRSKHDPAQHFAARFAAKEACVKALAAGGGRGSFWQDIEVVHAEGGRPLLHLIGRAERIAADLGVRRAHLSLSHTRETAVAVVVLED
ncbi:holo-ACP synthase [bacterium]|nr:holo-ACP synthase [bacterium]